MCRDSISSRNTRNKKENTTEENRIHPLFAGLVSTKTKPYSRKDKPIKNTDPEAIYKMLEQGHTQRFIALTLGVDQSTVSFWKRKKDASKIRTVATLSTG